MKDLELELQCLYVELDAVDAALERALDVYTYADLKKCQAEILGQIKLTERKRHA